jgi:hypothetical protein
MCPTTALRLQVRAGEGESEAENYVLTNPVAKTSMSSGLSSRGKAQVSVCCTEAHRMHLAAIYGCPDEQVRRSCVQSGSAMQVIKETMPALKALGACQSDCWLWPSITQVGSQASFISPGSSQFKN